jgi:biotin carboxyl carrier protein
MLYDVTIDGKNFRLDLQQVEKRWQCRLDDHEIQIDAVLTRRNVLSILIEGKAYEVKRERIATDLHLWIGSTRYIAEVRDPRSFQGRKRKAGDDKGPQRLLAPMPGKVVRVLLTESSPVEAGQSILVVEAMKMQNDIKSPKKGIVQKIVAGEGTPVNAGDVLAIVE